MSIDVAKLILKSSIEITKSAKDLIDKKRLKNLINNNFNPFLLEIDEIISEDQDILTRDKILLAECKELLTRVLKTLDI